MKQLAGLCLFLACATSAQADRVSDSAGGVLKRVFPSVASRFQFKTAAPAPTPYYRVQCKQGKVTIEASDGVAATRGAYDFLREAAGAQATWSGTTLGNGNTIPKFPDLAAKKVECPYRFVLQDNVCVFGYTTAFYGWKEWERYLDIMALHGVNMQFAPIGGEAIWDRVWTKLGIERKDLDNFFTGPAFLPWHRMGNINQHDGPLRDSYKSKSIVLQKQILKRMRELDITPVAPAFAGFVPRGFSAKHAGEKVLPVDSWAGFTGEATTQILHPLSPMYARIGGEYIREWKKEFGPAKYFLADSFNELNAPVSADRKTRLEELSGFGKAVYEGIRAGEPEGTWVMQGWLFYNEAKFWDAESVAALLRPVPNDRMLILDLFAEAAPLWKKHNAFHGKQWMVSTITTWGGNNQAYGNFELYRKLSSDTLSAPGHGNLVGFGISFEGSESNEAQYELLCDTAWSNNPIEMGTWLPALVRNRYGTADPDALSAWQKFEKSVYRMGLGIHPNHLLQSRPYALAATSAGQVHDSALFHEGVADLLKAGTRLKSNPLYVADVVQFTAQLALIDADKILRDAVLAKEEGESARAEELRGQLVTRSQQVDGLLASHPLDRLNRWVEQARAWGDNTVEKKVYESDAKRQVTVWGGPVLTEYAAKMWSGLITPYYVRRWYSWLNSPADVAQKNIRDFEERWIQTPLGPGVEPSPDPVSAAQKLVASLPPYGAPRYADKLIGTVIGGWRPNEITTELSTRTWDLTPHITRGGELQIRFQYTKGMCRLDIRGVELLADGQVIATDPHEGRTGLEHVANVYRLTLANFHFGTKYELRAQVRTDGGNDSTGTITLRIK